MTDKLEPILDQLTSIRSFTLKQLEGLNEEQADLIPSGFRNSIRWNAGHIYAVLERFALQSPQLPMLLPDGFKAQFEFGTSPADWQETPRVPALPELKELLSEQPERLRLALDGRLDEPVPPYTTSTGITLSTPRQFLTLGLYHEGMHFSVIKLYRRLLGC